MADEYVRHKQFEEYKQSLDRRFQDHASRLDGLHKGAHELRNVVAPLMFLKEKVDEMEGDLKELPTRKELENQTLILTTRIINFEERANEKAKTIKWLVTLVAPFVFGVVTIILTILAKMAHLL